MTLIVFVIAYIMQVKLLLKYKKGMCISTSIVVIWCVELKNCKHDDFYRH